MGKFILKAVGEFLNMVKVDYVLAVKRISCHFLADYLSENSAFTFQSFYFCFALIFVGDDLNRQKWRTRSRTMKAQVQALLLQPLWTTGKQNEER